MILYIIQCISFSGPIWLDDVECFGKEKDVLDCEHLKFGTHDCSHEEDAGVICGRLCDI